MFRVGQQVVCVDDKLGGHVPWKAPPPSHDWPEANNTYTIVGMHVYGGIPCLVLDEIKNGPWADYAEIGFAASRFRPVAKRKTDISIFTAMLNPAPQKQDA